MYTVFIFIYHVKSFHCKIVCKEKCYILTKHHLYRMVFKLCCCRSLLSRAASMCQLHHFCNQLLDRCQSILLLGPATMWLAKATLICMPAISVAGMLLSFQLFSLSWKLLKWTKQCFVHSVAMLHVTTFAKETSLVCCWAFGLAEPLSTAHVNVLWSCIAITCNYLIRYHCNWKTWFWVMWMINYFNRTSGSVVPIDWCDRMQSHLRSIILIKPLDWFSLLFVLIDCLNWSLWWDVIAIANCSDRSSWLIDLIDHRDQISQSRVWLVS